MIINCLDQGTKHGHYGNYTLIVATKVSVVQIIVNFCGALKILLFFSVANYYQR